MAHKTYGIDFGTGTVKVYKRSDGIILNERTVVATVGKGPQQRPVAIGDKAYEMFEKVPPNIKVSFPLEHGVISQMGDMISLWNFMLEKISGKRKLKNADFYIAVPADIREVGERQGDHDRQCGSGDNGDFRIVSGRNCCFEAAAVRRQLF